MTSLGDLLLMQSILLSCFQNVIIRKQPKAYCCISRLTLFLSLSETLACELLTKNSNVILASSLILKRPLVALTTIPFGVQKHTCGFLQCPAGPLRLTLLKCLNTGKIFNYAKYMTTSFPK